MREDWGFVERPQLSLFLRYNYLTAGEIGNILMRLQACVRSLEGLGPQGYVSELKGKPRFVVSSFYTKDSAQMALAVAGIVLMVTQPLWYDFATRARKGLIANTYFFVKGGLPGQEQMGVSREEFETRLVRGEEEDLRITADLSRLNKEQRRKLADFVYAVMYAASDVHLGDEEREILITRRSRKRGEQGLMGE